MAKKRKIVIVGGGFAGVKLALELGHDDHFETMLINPHDQVEYHGALYRSATGRSSLEVVLPFREVFAKYPKVQIINDLIVELRAATKELKGLSGEVYSYDAVVFALGYEKEYFNTTGAKDHTESMYTIFDSLALRNRMRDLCIKRADQECHVVVVGAGPTGIELAGDIETFAQIVADQYHVKPARPLVTIVDRAPRVLPMLSEEVSREALKRLRELGITFIGGKAVDHCNSRHLCLQEGKIIPADIIVWTAGNRANSLFEDYPESFDLDSKKRVVVNEFMQAKNPSIYVIGDAASTKFSGLAQTAISDAVQLGNNFKRFVRGEAIKPYRVHTPVSVVPIGPEWAITETNGKIVTGAAGWKVRRDADYWILSNYLSEALAKKHWRRGVQIAQLKTSE